MPRPLMSAAVSRLSEAADYGTPTARRPDTQHATPARPKRVAASVVVVTANAPVAVRRPRVVVHSIALLPFPAEPASGPMRHQR